MLAEKLFELRAGLRDAGIILAYCGYVTEPVLTGVGEALKQKLAIEDMDTKTTRNVFAVFVEQMQNIIRYSAEKEIAAGAKSAATRVHEIRYGILTIGKNERGFTVKTGNLVHAEDVARLRPRLEQVAAADRAALKALYKEQLKAGPDEFSKGAGVGFVEIARRASAPITFDFAPIDERFAFFALEAEIRGER
jgi:hypothetical protein